MTVAIILLAAGASLRLGQSKQLLTLNGMSLLERAAKTALQAKAQQVVVVLGCNDVDHQAAIKNLPVKIVVNPTWKNGIGNSIKAGLNHLISNTPVDAVIVMVCDQPLLQASHLQALIQTFEDSTYNVVASRYGGGYGVPALFSSSMFSKLLNLNDKHGAKAILQACNTIAAIDFAGGAIDIDTMEDFTTFAAQQVQALPPT